MRRRGRGGDTDARLRERFCPHVWLTSREMALLAVEERWALAEQRRTAAVRDYARRHGLDVAAARLRLWPPLRTRAEALARSDEPWHEPCQSESDARAAWQREHGWVAQRKRLLRDGSTRTGAEPHGAEDGGA